jgi:hypothetical protein
VPKQIERRKKLIAKSEECIRTWSVHIQKIQVLRGERDAEDVLDKPTRERFKRQEQKRISRCREVIKHLRDRQSNLEQLKQRLATWGSRPEDYETVPETEEVVVTFRDKVKLSKRYLEDHPDDHPKGRDHADIFPEDAIINSYLGMLSEFGILRDESRRFRDFPAIDRWRHLENEIILQAVRWGLVQPTEEAIKKHPRLGQGTAEPEHPEKDDPENQLIIKTGGSSIGASIYGAGTTWDGRQRQLSSFDNPVAHGNKDSGSRVAVPGGEFYSEIDSGDFEHDEQ